MATLRLIVGLAQPTSIPLDAAEVLLGRGKECTIRIGGNNASRNHCKISNSGTAWTVEDLGSSNGTYVNTERVEKKTLSDGDKVAVGEAIFLFEATPLKLTARSDSKLATRRMVVEEAPPPTPLSSIPVDLNYLVDTVMNVANGQLNGERSLILLYNDSGAPRLLWSQGFPDDPVKDDLNPVRRIVDKMKNLGKGIVVSAEDDPRSRLCAPIEGDEGGVIGAVYVDGPQGYTRDHLDFLKNVAARLGEPIRMAMNYRDLRSRLAMTNMELELNRVSPGKTKRLGNLIGRSKAMETVFSQIKRAASGAIPIVVEGEPGTGKEFVARAIHDLGPRAARAFVTVNFATVSPTTAATELFGQATGAELDRPGLFTQASGGTLFLNEIADASLDIQEKLLRFLQDGRILPEGATERFEAEVRIIAATTRPLAELTHSGNFNEELFARLSVVDIVLPPLRERPDDIPLFVHQFLREAGGTVIKEMAPDGLQALVRHPWPENVRQLKTIVERLCDLSEEPVITGDEVETVLKSPDQGSSTLLGFKRGRERTVERYERDFLLQAMERHKGNLAEVAEDMGLERRQVTKLVEKYRINPADYK